jgi:hypothetical protein
VIVIDRMCRHHLNAGLLHLYALLFKAQQLTGWLL